MAIVTEERGGEHQTRKSGREPGGKGEGGKRSGPSTLWIFVHHQVLRTKILGMKESGEGFILLDGQTSIQELRFGRGERVLFFMLCVLYTLVSFTDFFTFIEGAVSSRWSIVGSR